MRRMMTISAILAATLTLGACDQFKGETGAAGPAGPAGPKGDKGDPGAPGTKLRVVVSDSSTATCDASETLVSAYCRAASGDALQPNANLGTSASGADCGEGALATVICTAK